MKTVTVRDLRRRWPETEKALQVETEIVVTRDSKPVAKLVRVVDTPAPRRRFDPEAHGAWQRKTSGGKVTRWVDAGLPSEREERRRVSQHLENLTKDELDADRLRREQNELITRIKRAHPGFAASERLTREQVHDRRFR